MTTSPRHVSIEELLTHQGWVEALTRSLVGNVADAEDAGQQTWMAALEAPPQQRGNLRAWLARVLRHRPFDLRRARRRRAAREAAWRPAGHACTPEQLLERAETRTRVAQEVLALMEPYRSTVLLRYFEGQSVDAIARLQDVPPATVRTRLARAIARLRDRLKAPSGPDRLRALLVPIPGSGAGPASMVAVEAIVMTTQAKVAAGAAVVLLLAAGVHFGEGWLRQGPTETGRRPDRAGVRGVAEPAPVTLEVGRARAEGGEQGAGPVLPRGVLEGEMMPAGIVGGVVRNSAGTPLAGVDAFLWDEQGATIVHKGSTGQNGAFRFEGLNSTRYLLSLHTSKASINFPVAPGGRSLFVTMEAGSPPAPRESSAAAAPPPEARIAGIVVEEGTSRGLAGIFLRATPAPGQEGPATSIAFARTAVDGTFSLLLTGLPQTRWVIEAGPRAPLAEGAEAEFVVQQAGPLEIGTKDAQIRLSRGRTIEGEILGPDGGLWTLGATVRATPVVGGVRLGYDPVRDYDPVRIVRSGRDGRFRVPGLAADYYDLTVETIRDPSGAASMGFALVRGVLAGTRDLAIDLLRGQPLVGRLLDDAGEPVTGQGWLQVCRVGAVPGSPECSAADLLEGGRFQSTALDPDVAYVLRAGGFQGYARGELTNVHPGDRDLVLRLEKGAAFSGRLIDAKGDAVVGVWVSAGAVGRTVIIEGGTARTGADGKFEFAGAPKGAIRVGTMIRDTYVLIGEFTAPATDIVLRLPR